MSIFRKIASSLSSPSLRGLWGVLLLCLLVSSCARRPKGVLSNRKMVQVLTDVHRTEGILQLAGYTYGHDKDVMIYYQTVLERNGVTQAEFDSSLVWYTDHPAYFTRVYPKVLRNLQEMFDYEDRQLAFLTGYQERMRRDSLHLLEEPSADDIPAHKVWETRRTHMRDPLFEQQKAISFFTDSIRRVMKAEAEALAAAEQAEAQKNAPAAPADSPAATDQKAAPEEKKPSDRELLQKNR